jgi:AcrR family transcriptional regulator
LSRSTAQAIREEAASLFFERGYDATSLRQVAAAVGLKVGSLYNHIESKEDLLLQIMGGILDDLLSLQKDALAIEGDAIDRLLVVLEGHYRFHAVRAQEVAIGNAELRSLSDDSRKEMIRKRGEYEDALLTLIIQAGEAGLASVLDPKIHTYSFVAQAKHLASWYESGGRLSLEEIVRLYTKMALRELLVHDPDGRVERLWNNSETTVEAAILKN